MSETNYNESVIIPMLQRKFQELTNQNMVLEANLLIERQKNLDLQKQIEELMSSKSNNKDEKKKKKSSEEFIDASTY